MPEGPSLIILREQAAAFAGQTIVRVEGNTSIDKQRLAGQRIVALRTWGKHFLVELPTFTLRVHFLLFGSYRINERKDAPRGSPCSANRANSISTPVPSGSSTSRWTPCTTGRPT